MAVDTPDRFYITESEFAALIKEPGGVAAEFGGNRVWLNRGSLNFHQSVDFVTKRRAATAIRALKEPGDE